MEGLIDGTLISLKLLALIEELGDVVDFDGFGGEGWAKFVEGSG